MSRGQASSAASARPGDASPQTAAAPDSHAEDDDDDIFALLPPQPEPARPPEPRPGPEPKPVVREASPRPANDSDIFKLLPPELAAAALQSGSVPRPADRSRPTANMTDLSRLSVDAKGQLCLDGTPVETRHRMAMSRGQIAAASFVVLLVAIGALGAAVQGLAAARDWACQLGWSHSVCVMPAAASPARPDIAE
jgi:hypothetical protein